jgi:hypothetical protein
MQLDLSDVDGVKVFALAVLAGVGAAVLLYMYDTTFAPYIRGFMPKPATAAKAA